MRHFHMSAEERGTVDFDLCEQRAKRAVRSIMPGGTELGVSLASISRRSFRCHTGMRMTATAGGFVGSLGMEVARAITAGPVTAREQRVERLPEQPERRKREQRAERDTAIDSGNQG